MMSAFQAVILGGFFFFSIWHLDMYLSGSIIEVNGCRYEAEIFFVFLFDFLGIYQKVLKSEYVEQYCAIRNRVKIEGRISRGKVCMTMFGSCQT